jgi:hypothetical protein
MSNEYFNTTRFCGQHPLQNILIHARPGACMFSYNCSPIPFYNVQSYGCQSPNKNVHVPILPHCFLFFAFFFGSFHSELKLLARAADYSKRYSHAVSVTEWIQWCRFKTCNQLPKKKAVKLMKRVYCWWWIVSLFASIAWLLRTTYI